MFGFKLIRTDKYHKLVKQNAQDEYVFERMEKELVQLRKMNVHQRREVNKYMHECARLMGLVDYYRAEMQRPKPGLDIAKDDIRKLLSLCHPDKHGGKAVATEMTAKLLSMRG